MKADAVPLLAIFEKKLRLEVPLFQRQYVWNREDQWEPLWEDICRKFSEHLSGRKDAPAHFLGAMVLDQKQTPTAHVERRQVIDGQQRLTTLQIFLAAFRDLCKEEGCEELAKESESFTLNKGMMADPEIDKFKVWPTQLDRDQFKDVIASGSRAALEAKHPVTRRKYARTPDPRPRMVEAYLFFYDQLSDFFLGTAAEPALAAEHPLAARLEECFQALRSALLVVAVDLDQADDAQVIFETLNARGEPLLPADLLRNYIFLRAARQGEPQEALYEQHWKRFDDPFWREEVRQGRLVRPRSDLFMQHFLASRQSEDIPIKHLFVEYKFWIERKRPFASIQDELEALARQGDDFRRIIEPKRDDPLFPLATFLNTFDVRTAYPLLLFLLDADLSETQWKEVADCLESYLLRRAVCGLTTKALNRIFLTLTRALARDGAAPENIRKHLAGLSGESSEWPTNEALAKAWQESPAYQTLNNPKLVHILRRLSDTYSSGKVEAITVAGPLSVEHILPQDWIEHWPLPDGSTGLTAEELWDGDADAPRTDASRHRNSLIQAFGNLTILTQALNSSVSNSAWSVKKPELMRYSLLPLNQQLHAVETWDEKAIEHRSRELFARAIALWPAPHQ